jgi:hypothetical protein
VLDGNGTLGFVLQLFEGKRQIGKPVGVGVDVRIELLEELSELRFEGDNVVDC